MEESSKIRPSFEKTSFYESFSTRPLLGNFEMKGKATFWTAVIHSQLFGLGCVILMIVWTVHYLGGLSWSGKNQFNYHPLLFAIGMIYLYGDAIIVYRVFPHRPKLHLKIIHATLHAAVLILTTVALVAVFEYKKFYKMVDLYSLHSWIGISTVALFAIQYFAGFIVFFLPWVPKHWKTKFLRFHTFFGVGLFLMALASALTGLTEKLQWTKDYSEFAVTGIIGNCYGLCLVVFGSLVVFLVTDTRFKRQPTVEEIPNRTIQQQDCDEPKH